MSGVCNGTEGPPGLWTLLRRRLGPRTAGETCDVAIAASIVAALATFLASSALALHVFRRLRRSGQPFSLLQVSLVVSDAVGATALAVQALAHTLFGSVHSNASCLSPSRGRWLRLVDVPAELILLGCCLDRVESIVRPNAYRVVDRRRRCVWMNALCYGGSWAFALLSHCLVVSTRIAPRPPHPFTSPAEILAHPNSRSWLIDLCNGSAENADSDFWYSQNERRVCFVSNDNYNRDKHFPPTLAVPSCPEVKTVVDIALGLATVTLVVAFVRRPRLRGQVEDASAKRRKAEERQRERGTCLALGAEAAVASLSGLPAALLFNLLRPLLASNSSHRTAIIVLGLGVGSLPQFLVTSTLLVMTSSIFRKELYTIPVFRYRPPFLHPYLFIYLVFFAPMILAIFLIWLVRYHAFGHLYCM